MSTALGGAAGLSAITVFAGMADVARREANAGLSPVAFAVGRMLADTLLVVVNALIFTGAWTLFGHAGHWYAWVGVCLPTAFAASGIGYTAAVSTRPVNAAVLNMLAVTTFAVFSGIEPTLHTVAPLHVVNWPWYLSFATWTAESAYVTWSGYVRDQGVPDAWARVKVGADHFGFELEGGQGRSIGALVGIGLLWRVVAAAVLYRKTRGG